MYDSQKISQLKNKISEAFDKVSPKTEIAIEHDCDECWELDETFSVFKSWKEIPTEIITINYNKLPLFNPEAFHCFLPAYLIYALDHIDEDNEVYDFCCYHFMIEAKESESQIEWHKERYSFFNKNQLKLNTQFIDLAIENEDFEGNIKQLKRGKNLIDEIIKTIV